MTKLIQDQATGCGAGPLGFWTKVGRGLADFFADRVRRRRHRRAMADLLRHGGDDLFKDIGIERATVVAEYYHPTRHRNIR